MNSSNFLLFSSLIFLNFLSFLTYGIPIAFFPSIAKSKGASAFMVGIIFSMYPIGAFIFGFLVGKMLCKWDKKNFIISSQIFMGVFILLFGYSYLFSWNLLFIMVALISRTGQGSSLGAFQTAAYAYVPEYWPDEIDFRIGFLEMTVGLGIGAGPLIGTLFYSLWGYNSIYIGPAVLITCFGSIWAYMVLPKNKIREKNEINETISISKSFSDKDMWYTFFVLVINYGGFCLMLPEVENKVIEIGGTPEKTSFLIAFYSLGYIFSIVILMVSKFENGRCIFFFSLILSIVGLIFIGLDKIIPLPNFLIFISMSLGNFIVGISSAFALIPNVSENIKILKKIFPDTPKYLLDNMASGIFTAAISLAEFQGPILGGFLCDFFGFSTTLLIYSILELIFLIFYATDGKGWNAFLSWAKSKNKNTINGREEESHNLKNLELKLLESPKEDELKEIKHIENKDV